MLSTLQITAILYLLIAFGVPQTTVNNVQGILEHAGKSTQNAPVQVQAIPEGIGGVGSLPVQDCTPILEARVTQFEGNVTTGTGYMFFGTSTLPIGCSTNTSTEVYLQTPSGKYKGTIGSWAENRHGKITDTVFTYNQGWGTPPGITPSGQFIWTVGTVSTTTSI